MGLISPGGENLLDFLELRQVLSTYDGDHRDPLWWSQDRPVPMGVAGGLSGFLSRRFWGLITTNLWNFQRVLHTLVATQEVPRHTRLHSRGSISPSKEHPGLISFRMNWLDLLAVQGTLRSLLQHHSSKASILRYSAFFTVQLSHPYMTPGKTILCWQSNVSAFEYAI